MSDQFAQQRAVAQAMAAEAQAAERNTMMSKLDEILALLKAQAAPKGKKAE